MVQRTHQTLPRPVDTTPDNFRRTPQAFPRTTRSDNIRAISTTYAGVMHPVFAIPLLREDRLLSTQFRFSIEMDETAAMLMNAVRVEASVWVVPKLAFDRFRDMGQITRSYLGQNEADGSPIPWFVQGDYTDVGPNPAPFYRALGAHARAANAINTDYVESYNAIWNYMKEQASPAIDNRDHDDYTLAPAFWQHTTGRHIKPTFDQALLHGDVNIALDNQFLDVLSSQYQTIPNATGEITPGGSNFLSAGQADLAPIFDAEAGEDGMYRWQNVVADLQSSGASFSLADIDLARKTAAFARARQAYQGLGDQEIIDLLMSGVQVPDELLNYPQLLGIGSTIVGMSQRYATDSGNLDASVTRGQTFIDVMARTPRITTGGVVMGVVQIVPEQLYERKEDPYLSALDVDSLPNRLRDELDLEPIEVVMNGEMDTDHSEPNDTFGYAPLNHRWQRDTPNIGGRYHRPDASSPWNEDRNRIWAVEQVDPKLGDDYYLASNIHHEVFLDSNKEPFEVTCSGMARIEGNTMFGPALRESYGDYEAIAAHQDRSKIQLPAPAEE